MTRGPITTPYTIAIDTAEQQPYPFLGLRADADQDYRPLTVPLLRMCLGRHPNSLGDYSLTGFIGRVHIERKSVNDCIGTICGFGENGEDKGRRERFESELANLSKIEAPLVIVEGSLATVLASVQGWEGSSKTAEQWRKIVFRSLIAWQQDYLVRWQFCDTRALAEYVAFRYLERFYKHHRKEMKANGSGNPDGHSNP